MSRVKGPGIFLAQFVGDEAPFNALASIADWAAGLGYKGVQIPTWESRLFDLREAARSQTYADDLKGMLAEKGLAVTELASHVQGQLMAVHPAYDPVLAGVAGRAAGADPESRRQWAEQQLRWCAEASRRLGLSRHVTFSGSLLWPYIYPYPQRPAGLVDVGFDELARRWRPLLDAFDEAGVDLCYELHPVEDLHDGDSFDLFLERVDGHRRCCILYDPSHMVLQGLDYLAFIDIYHERIKMFHVKDAELRPTGRQGVYGGFRDWVDRAGRFRSLGDGQIDFRAIFSKLAAYGYDGWAVLEWECCLKSPQQGAREGAPFIADRIIDVTDRAFDDFIGAGMSRASLRGMLGLPAAGGEQ